MRIWWEKLTTLRIADHKMVRTTQWLNLTLTLKPIWSQIIPITLSSGGFVAKTLVNEVLVLAGTAHDRNEFNYNLITMLAVPGIQIEASF